MVGTRRMIDDGTRSARSAGTRLVGALLGLAFLAIGTGPLQAGQGSVEEVLIDFDAAWRYHDGDEDLGDAWLLPDYDDSEWSEGPALLGYAPEDRGEQWPGPGLQTNLQEHLITYYFRKEFDYTGPTEGVRLRLDQIVDDGAVYYLNGEEIGRSELMPEGTVGFGTRTTSWTNPVLEEDVFDIDASLLREGRNVLAVSVHNNAASSSDICFGARMTVKEGSQTPLALYLTWQRDPTTTMTIQWHTEGQEDDGVLEYRLSGDDSEPTRLTASRHPMPYSDRKIHTVELVDLEPGTEYNFRIYHPGLGQSSPSYAFRTMPAEASRPIRYAVGGDTRHNQGMMEQTNRVAMQFDPDFIVWGGDLAYADGREDYVERWYEWFDAYRNTLIAEDGRVVPVLAGIGNHEVRGHFYSGDGRGSDAYEDSDAFREQIGPYYFSLFAFPGHPGYGVLDFGDYLSIFLLDTDHAGPIIGRQTSWLEEQLAKRADVPHLLPVYHVPAYPSVRDFYDRTSTRVREHWVPLFEQYGVQVAFENHDHAYKRTVPILGGEEHEDGIVFIGDGAWGVGTRSVHPVEETWYLHRAEPIRHLILVTLHEEFQDFKVIDDNGMLIDHYVPSARNRETAGQR